MPREFIINLDNSWVTGSTSGGVVTTIKPFIQFVNNVPALKNTSYPYKTFVGDQKLPVSKDYDYNPHVLSEEEKKKYNLQDMAL